MANQTATNMQAATNMQTAANMQSIVGGQNFIFDSQNLLNGLWNKQGGTTVTPNQLANPINGNVDAWLVDATTAGGGQGIFQGVIIVPYLKLGMVNCKSVWLRGFIGGEVFRLRDPVQGTLFIDCVLTTTWQLFSLVDFGQDWGFGIWLQKISGNKFYYYNAQLSMANNRGPEQITTPLQVLNPILNIP